MTFPRIYLEELKSEWLADLNRLETEISKNSNNELVTRTCLQSFDLLKNSLQASLTDYTVNFVKIATKALFKLKLEISEESYKDLNLIITCRKLDSLFQSIKNGLEHKEEIDHSQENILESSWGKEVVFYLIQKENQAAINLVENGLLEVSKSAIHFIYNNRMSGKWVENVLTFCVKQDGWQRLIENKLNNPETEGEVYTLLRVIFENKEYEWASEILVQKADESNYAAQVILNILNNSKIEFPYLFSFLIDRLKKSKEWAIKLVLQFLSKENNRINNNFYEKYIKTLCEAASQSFELQGILIAYAALYKYEYFSEVLIEEMSNFQIMIFFEQPIVLIEKVSFFITTLQESISFLKKDDFITISIIRLYLHRQRDLIEIIKNGDKENFLIDPPFSKCFPKTESILSGFGSQFERLIFFLRDSLKDYDLQICSAAFLNGFKRSFPINLDFQFEKISHLWAQDYFFANQSTFRLPDFEIDLFKLATLKKYRDKRMFEVLGDNYDSQSFQTFGYSLELFRHVTFSSSFIKNDPTLKSLVMQFTANEGGNCLVGEFKGEPFAIIGKDALEYNRVKLQKEINSLGFRKIENKWVKLSSRELKILEDENLSELSLDEIRYFFMRDLGLNKIDQVIFVEQGEYHLDMFIANIKENLFWVNDSVESACVLENYLLNSELRGFQVESEVDYSELKKRLQKVHLKAKKMKQYEDQAASDLVKAGFEVVRIPGCFMDLTKKNPKNFQTNHFNFTTMTMPNNDKVILSLGSENYFNKLFTERISEFLGNEVKIIFLDEKTSYQLLSNYGGIHCVLQPLNRKLKNVF